ncbi:hypothetical protein M5K25_022441 [Dendrobium thyrsiflorum]|uniref:Uncharacterized protein n=1 Tax=Dendrobium thyrsiflorum TaxID=117978 RepID=A0ABD0U675_DENTH
MKESYLAATAEVRGIVISLWPIPTRQILPPVRVAFSALDIVLLKPAQSKFSSWISGFVWAMAQNSLAIIISLRILLVS